MSATQDPPAGVPGVMRRLLADDPGRPRVTWYGPNGERVELSAKTLDNWVSKTSNLLVDELDAGPGARLGVALPAHWRTLVWLLAGWTVGAHLVVFDEQATDRNGAAGDGPDSAPSPIEKLTALVTDRPSCPPPGTRESVLVVVPLPALATRFAGDVPSGALDAAAEVRLQPDVFPGSRGPAPFESSRATMNKTRDFSFSADRLGSAPINTMRSISPGVDRMDASPAAAPPKLPPITETALAPCAFK
jgi:uncharacterized protein (TIGR03089 family)